jgi:uncharacterized protein (DUF4213/DUF364 family)
VRNAILTETIAAVRDILGSDLDTITLDRAVIGLFFTGVKLSSGEAGTCATPHDAAPDGVCCPLAAHGAPFRRIKGQPAAEVIEDVAASNGTRRAVAIATLNALAERCWRVRPHPEIALHPKMDAFEAADIGPSDTVVLVGAFIPFLKQLKARRQSYLVLEQNPAALKAEEMPFYRPAAIANEVVPLADILLITGATLLNDTLEDLLALARPQTRVTVLGPSVGMLPDAFVARGTDALGSVRVTAPDEFLDIIGEGGSAPHFLGRQAEKIALVRRITTEPHPKIA